MEKTCLIIETQYFRYLQYNMQSNYYILRQHAINIGKHNYMYFFINSTLTNMQLLLDRYEK